MHWQAQPIWHQRKQQEGTWISQERDLDTDRALTRTQRDCAYIGLPQYGVEGKGSGESCKTSKQQGPKLSAKGNLVRFN